MLLNTLFNQLVDVDIPSLNTFGLLSHNSGGPVDENLLIIRFRKGFVLSLMPLLNTNHVKLHLKSLSLDDLLLNCVLRNEAVHKHFSLLPNPVGSVHSLQINLRVPIGIEQDNMVGTHKVNT